jgi:hypothetical protein
MLDGALGMITSKSVIVARSTRQSAIGMPSGRPRMPGGVLAFPRLAKLRHTAKAKVTTVNASSAVDLGVCGKAAGDGVASPAARFAQIAADDDQDEYLDDAQHADGQQRHLRNGGPGAEFDEAGLQALDAAALAVGGGVVCRRWL